MVPQPVPRRPLRCLKGYAHRKGVGWGRIVAPSPAELAGARPAAGWIVPAAALDACLVAGAHYLAIEFQSELELPQKFERLRLGRWPRAGETCLVELRCRRREDGRTRFDFTLFGDDDAPLLQAEGYQTIQLGKWKR